MHSVWSLVKSANVVAFLAVVGIGAIECGGSEKNGTGGKTGTSGQAGSSGHTGTSDAGGTGGSGGTGGTGGAGGADAGESVLDSGTAGSADAARACHWPQALTDAGPGVRACAVGRAYVSCTYPGGNGCGCISDDPAACPGCGPASGATCKNLCAADEYAVSCGGPPIPLADGAIGSSYQEVPEACVNVAFTQAGNTFACCPCE